MWSRIYREHPYVPARDPLQAIPPSRHPFQLWVLVALLISGLANFLTPGSEVLQEGLNPLMHKTWALTLTVSALMALASAWWRDRITGLLLERTGLLAMGVSCPLYALIVYLQSGLSVGVPGITLTTLLGGACLNRAIHVHRELKILRHFVTRHFR
jgi:hypothetical protein